MRSLIIPVILLLFYFGCEKKVDLTAEEAAIKIIIQMQSKAFSDRSLDGEKAVWANKSYIMRITSVGSKMIGWDSVAARYKSLFAQWPAISRDVSYSNYHFRIIGHSAWVVYDQRQEWQDDSGNKQTAESSEIRFLEKINNQWKIVFQKSDFASAQEQSAEYDINNAGYKLLDQEKTKAAIDVFKLNVKLYPHSSNVYDSLGEAYMKDGQKKMAIKNYEKSLKLDPKNDNARQMLKKLKP